MEKILWQSKGKGREKVAVIKVNNPEYYGRASTHKTIPARLYYYKKYHPEEDTKGYFIVHLDNDTSNFSKDNLVKLKRRVWLLILGQQLWSDDIELNKTAILIASNQDISKTIRGKTGREAQVRFKKRKENENEENNKNNIH